MKSPTIYALVRHFKSYEPLKQITVRFVADDRMPKCRANGKPYYGLAEDLGGGKWRIRILKRLTQAETVDALIEEFAHIRAGIVPASDPSCESNHGPKFQAARGKFYNIYQEWLARGEQ